MLHHLIDPRIFKSYQIKPSESSSENVKKEQNITISNTVYRFNLSVVDKNTFSYIKTKVFAVNCLQ